MSKISRAISFDFNFVRNSNESFFRMLPQIFEKFSLEFHDDASRDSSINSFTIIVKISFGSTQNFSREISSPHPSFKNSTRDFPKEFTRNLFNGSYRTYFRYFKKLETIARTFWKIQGTDKALHHRWLQKLKPIPWKKGQRCTHRFFQVLFQGWNDAHVQEFLQYPGNSKNNHPLRISQEVFSKNVDEKLYLEFAQFSQEFFRISFQ